jgi:hypothetical protein
MSFTTRCARGVPRGSEKKIKNDYLNDLIWKRGFGIFLLVVSLSYSAACSNEQREWVVENVENRCWDVFYHPLRFLLRKSYGGQERHVGEGQRGMIVNEANKQCQTG